jgi:hypothetical protein
MSSYAPRFRGRAIPRGAGWSYEITITIGPDTEDNVPIIFSPKLTEPTFMSELSAINAMKADLPEIMRETCRAMGLPEPAGVHNLKEGVMQDMDEFSKPDQPKGKKHGQ